MSQITLVLYMLIMNNDGNDTKYFAGLICVDSNRLLADGAPGNSVMCADEIRAWRTGQEQHAVQFKSREEAQAALNEWLPAFNALNKLGKIRDVGTFVCAVDEVLY